MKHCYIDNLACKSRKHIQIIYVSSLYITKAVLKQKYISNNLQLLILLSYPPSARWTDFVTRPGSCYAHYCVLNVLQKTFTKSSCMHFFLIVIWRYTMLRIKPCNLPFKLCIWYMQSYTGLPSSILSLVI